MSDVTCNFVIPEVPGRTPGELERIDIDREWRVFNSGPFNWSLLTFLVLRGSGIETRLSHELDSACVNLVHAAQLAAMSPAKPVFAVSLQADYPPVPWAEFHVVQNQTQKRSHNSIWIPHWLQPGLVPRSGNRKGVDTVAFAGNASQMAGSPKEWRDRLAGEGLEFRHLDKENWNDFSEVDVLLGIRSFDGNTYDRKPATKLFIAWAAGAPLVAGPDSAYRQVGRPGRDYEEALTMEDAIQAVRSLGKPGRYQAMIDAGRESLRDYTREAICARWRELIRGPLGDAFGRWCGAPSASARRFKRRYLFGKSMYRLKRTVRGIVSSAGGGK